jgi:non-specific serine/threonine protein kinase
MKERSWAIRGHEQVEWMRRLRIEQDNFRSALTWATEHDPAMALRLAASLGKYWEIHGDWTEGRQWLDRLLVAADGGYDPTDVARAQQVLGTLAMQQEDHASARQLIESALDHFRSTGDIDRVEWAVNDLAILAMDAEGDLDRARGLLEEARELATSSGSGNMAPVINLGWLAMEVSQWDAARPYFEEGLATAPNDQESVGWCLLGLATLDWIAGSFEKARAGYDECVRLWKEIDAESMLVYGLVGQGLVARDTGDAAAAAAPLAEALAIARHLGGGVRYVFCLGIAGSLLGAVGRCEEALTLASATENLIDIHRWPIKRWFRADLDNWATTAAAGLDVAGADRARAAGASLSVGDALRLAEEATRITAGARS